jgi:uncharacterized membrane protein
VLIAPKAAIPGEWFWYQRGFRRIGIILHLVTILPAGFLVCFQFVPVVRHKVLIFHRINGYVIITLFFFSIVGVLMITRHAVGGSPNTQAAIGTLTTLTTFSLCMAYYNIKCLQIDQHRAWMLRTWIYAGTIISLRLIMLAANRVVYAMKDYYDVAPCQIIFNEYSVAGIPNAQNPAFKVHPNCPSGDLDGYVAVHADTTGPEGAAAATNLTFGMSLWIALVIHAIGVEVYLRLTPAESERLRVVSYERQLEAGFDNPGSAGLTVDRFGDASRWQPPTHLASSKHTANKSVPNQGSG